ncbi:NADP-dependent oxidoreductase domain-containing protein [Penicillium brevicompactum]|uniref:D-xylose reductase [NAD(P)H] n=1 Tax=Penicillium brevicompactum TaxID=5074 RepID=A0A9W9UQX0_PENBR|nr:NADP-dependent oxidoreductase domain-containing protein [Penicillium brevicompactum]
MAKRLDLNSTQAILSGYEIPVLGYGLYQVPGTLAEALTGQALKAGYRHIDSAAVYANEKECVSAVRAAGLKRSDVFLTTKISPQAFGYDAARQSIDKSLEQAQTEYFDLILINAPFGGKDGRLGSWKALVEAQKAGKARSIGVSNFGLHHLEELEEYIQNGGGGRIEVGQYELHPWLGRAELVHWLQSRGAVIEAYSPLVRGTRMNEPVLGKLGVKHQKNPAQILLRWSIQKVSKSCPDLNLKAGVLIMKSTQGFVPLPKSATTERIQENINVFDFELDEEDMRLLHTDDYSPSTWDPTVQRD